MNLRELVDHIRSGPAELMLNQYTTLTRSNLCDFNEFLQALQSSETIRTVFCGSQLLLGITENEWVLLVKTLGSIKDIQHLELNCRAGSRDFRPFQAFADALNNAHTVCKLRFDIVGETFPRDSSGLAALAKALREHTALEEFTWSDLGPSTRVHATIPRARRPTGRGSDITAVDPVLWALPACPHLRKVLIGTKCGSADALKNLLQMHEATELHLILKTEHLLAVTDEIRHGRCNVKGLLLCMSRGAISEATEAMQALASAIRWDCNMEHLTLEVENGFTDEVGVALAEALMVNKSLVKITLGFLHKHNQYTFGVHAYDAFSAMLRVNTSLVLYLPPFELTGRVDARLLESRNKMLIEQRLNQVGRGRLMASRQTSEEYVDALHELNSFNVRDPPAFQVSCLYSLLRLNPSVCIS
jgi:hypothetical protein